MTREHRPLKILAWPLDRSGENPYTNNLYRALSSLGHLSMEFSLRDVLLTRYDVLHVHWPEGVVAGRRSLRAIPAALAMGLVLALARARGAVVVWTVHNERPHERSSARAVRILHRVLGATVSGLLFLSNDSRESFSARHAWAALKPSAVTPHGRFGPFELVSAAQRDATRASLGFVESDLVVAFLGRMEDYKGPADLVTAFRGREAGSSMRLLMAGRVPPGDSGERLREAMRAPGIVVEEGWISDQRFAELAAAADLVVYPYRRIFNSGSVLLPIEFGTPVQAPARGSLREVSAMVGEGWLRLYDGTIDAAKLEAALHTSAPQDPPDLNGMEWPTIAQLTAEFMGELCVR